MESLFHSGQPVMVDLILALTSVFVFVGVRVVHGWVCCRSGVKNRLIPVALDVLSGLVFLGYSYLLQVLWPNALVSPFLWNFSVFYLGLTAVDSVLVILPNKPTYVNGRIIKFLFFLAFAVSLLISYDLYPSRWFSSPELRKVLIALGGAILSLAVLRYSISKTVGWAVVLLYFGLVALWVANRISFDLLTISLLFSLVFLFLGYVWFVSDLAERLKGLVGRWLSEEDSLDLSKGYKLFVTAGFLFLVELVLVVFLGQNPIQGLLSRLYLIRSGAIEITIYRLYHSLLIGAMVWGAIKVFKKLVKAYFPEDRRDFEGASAETVIFNLGILVLVIVVMSTLGITWKIILPVAGTLGIGIGFGLQTIMNNYMSGFILLFSQKIRVGDIVEVSVSTPTLGQSNPTVFGKVEEIGILATTIRTNDGVDIAIPNSNFINSPIINYSHKDSYVRLRLPVGVAYSSDPEKVKAIILESISEIPGVLKRPEPVVWFYDFGSSALVFVATFWFDIRRHLRINRLRDKFYTTVWYKLKENGIEIPFPQNDVWFRNELRVRLDKGGGL